MFQKPTHFELCCGSSEGYTQLNAFDACLLKAGVGNTNLMRMSSILPPHVQRAKPDGFEPGSFLPIAYGSIESDKPGELIAAGVAIGVPEDRSLPGVIMEHSAVGSAAEVEEHVRNMAEQAMILRGYKISEILSIAAEHRVESIGAAFAGVVLFNK
jgi:arginine decarboxylase